jgi:hypothetical protein
VTGAEFRGVDIDLLADYIGGALSGTPDESVVATLIADDPAWQAAYESLSGGMAAVSAELGRLEAEPMPAEVIARLDAALASPIDPPISSTTDSPVHSPADPSATDSAIHSPADSWATDSPVHSPADSSSSSAAASTIADAEPISAELAAPPAPHLTLVRGDAADDVPQTDETPRERGSKRSHSRRLRWATPIAIAAGVIAFVGFGLDYLAGRDPAADNAATTAAGSAEQRDAGAIPTMPRLTASGTNYSASTLAVAPVAPLAASGAMKSESAPMSAPDLGNTAASQVPALNRLRDPVALQQCLDAIAAENTGGPIHTDTVDFAQFDGSPAIVVHFSADNGSWAWAAGPACGPGGDANTLGKAPVR